MKKKIGIVLLVIFIAIQFVRIDKTNPPVEKDMTFEAFANPPEEVTAILDMACMDCHSNETVYPWYSNVAPISWKLKGHIDGGREKLNFSEWKYYSETDKAYIQKEIVEVVEKKEMPMLMYWLVHWDAKLTDEQRGVLVDYFK